jgi:hypothetical protein
VSKCARAEGLLRGNLLEGAARRGALQAPNRVTRRAHQALKRGTPFAAGALKVVDGMKPHRAAYLTQLLRAIPQTLFERRIEDPQPGLLYECDQVHVVARGNAAQQVIAAQVHPGFGRVGNEV